MSYEKITQADLEGKGVIGLPDTPELTAGQMQEKFEQTAREVIIPKYNTLIDALTENGRPVQSEDVQQIKVDTDGDVKVFAAGRWQRINPTAMSLKADKSDTYTKSQTDAAINQKVVEIGAGDMTKAVYDINNMGIVDDAQKLGGQLPSYYGKAPISKTLTLTASGWSDLAPYTQTVNVEGITADDNPIADVDVAPDMATAKNQLEAWSCVSRIETSAGSITATCLEDKPTVDIPVRMMIVR